ncbi:MAG: energy transducer TonB [Dysgonamonadaceae bacterium]|jgi:TonB family protein|nr:energy transducer TonB [Dysgonamonadaceae bacterium]
MELTREETCGIFGSIFFYIVLLLILYFTFLKTEIKTEEEGVLVNFGTVNLAEGTFTPKGDGNKVAPQEESPAPPAQKISEPPKPQFRKVPSVAKTKPTPPPITQNLEQTAAIEATKRKEREKAAAEQAVKAKQAQLAEEQRKRDAINRQVSGAFGTGATGSGNKGTVQTDSGVQGNPQSTATSAQSASDYGEFNLGGRTLSAEGLPKPAYSAQEEGSIVVNITVDPQGNVISAEIGKGTTVSAMHESALDAARRAKFSSIDGNNNQSGTITYKYKLKGSSN